MYQQQYWKELYQLKVHTNYISAYLEESELYNRYINAFLSVTSSSSICGWAIWQEYDYIWAFIIAFSQLINVVKAYLPYKSRMKPLSGLLHEFEQLMIQAESKWYEVSEGQLTNKGIHNLRFAIRSQKIKSLKKSFPSGILPENKKLFDGATEKANTYFSNFYGV